MVYLKRSKAQLCAKNKTYLCELAKYDINSSLYHHVWKWIPLKSGGSGRLDIDKSQMDDSVSALALQGSGI